MRLSRSFSWVVAFALFASVGATTGCKASVEMSTKPPPPPPPPPPDQDGDGIPDAEDKCPAEAEDGNPPDPKDGCPNKDMDGDGIPIPDDQCPNEPETVNDFEDTDGCPDKKPLVQLKEREVQINQKIMFEKGSAEIKPESQPVIDAVADLLVKNPEVQLIEVGGHASKEGGAWFNRDLTQKRVDSVVKALADKGVEKERLLSTGYGFYCVLAEGETEADHEKNRRVEFKIIYRKGKSLDQKLGCEEAEKKNIKAKVPELKDIVKQAPAEGAKAVKPLKPAAAAETAKPAEAAKPAAAAKPADAAKPAEAAQPAKPTEAPKQ